MLASLSSSFFDLGVRCWEWEGEDSGDEEEGIVIRPVGRARVGSRRLQAGGGASDSTNRADQTRDAALYVEGKATTGHSIRRRADVKAAQHRTKSTGGQGGGVQSAGRVAHHEIQQDARCGLLTIGNGQPPVLLLDLEVITQTVIAWVVCAVHLCVWRLLLIFVGRRSGLFDVLGLSRARAL